MSRRFLSVWRTAEGNFQPSDVQRAAQRAATPLAIILTAVAVLMVSGIRSSGAAQSPSPKLASTIINLGAPRQLFHFGRPDSLGLFNAPDMHTAMLQQADGTYLLWMTGDSADAGDQIGIFRLATRDFEHITNAGPGGPSGAAAVMMPTCETLRAEPRQVAEGKSRGEISPSGNCALGPDADYVGANAVFKARNGRDLVMLYEAGNKTPASGPVAHGWEYNVVALARSSDMGITWLREGTVLSGSDPKPVDASGTAQPGISEFGAIIANDFIYVFFQYVPNSPTDPDAPSVVEVARAPISEDGAAGSWRKYFRGDFSEPGLGGRGTPVVTTGRSSPCTRPVEVWPAFNEEMGVYVLIYVCNEGWFFSTSTDLTSWTPPKSFLDMSMWQRCKPMDWNFVLVTPGKPAGVIGNSGLVLYAHSDAKGLGCPGGFVPHELWSRPFSFNRGG